MTSHDGALGSWGRSAPQPGYPVVWVVATRWADNDMFGHLNNAVYYQLFDTAINAWLTDELSLDPASGSRMWVVAESGCRFGEAVGFPELLAAGISISRVGTSSVTYDLALFRHRDTREPGASPVARGRWVHVFVNRTTGRPERIPDDVRALFEATCASQPVVEV